MFDQIGVTGPYDALSQGNAARRSHLGKDACPYPLRSREREDWLDGYEGQVSEEATPKNEGSRNARSSR